MVTADKLKEFGVGQSLFRAIQKHQFGLAERRYGNFLHNKERSEYVLSTKVGKQMAPAGRELRGCSKSPDSRQ